jgi:hypothetical protein
VQTKSQSTVEIEQRLRNGESTSSIARHFGISRARVYQINVRLLKADGFSELEFKRLCLTYNNCCVCCGLRLKLCADHVIPVSWGHLPEYQDYDFGHITNIQPLCLMCNSNKADKDTDYRRNPHPNCLQPLQPLAPLQPHQDGSVCSESFMRHITVKLTSPMYDALVEACSITNRKDPDDAITVEDYAEECIVTRLVELGLVRKYRKTK